MLTLMHRLSAASVEDEERLDLPPLDGQDEHEGLDDPAEIDMRLPDEGEADDETAELPLGIGLEIDQPGEPSVLGDDAAGCDDAPPTLGLHIDERAESLLDRADPDLGSAGEDVETGLEPLPANTDRTDAEGLDDPKGESLSAEELPTLDVGGDDEEVEVGIELPAPEPSSPEPGAGGTDGEEG